MKPCTSAGTDNVTVCVDEADIRAAFAKIIHQENRMGFRNEAVVVQDGLDVLGIITTIDVIEFLAERRAA